jgi:carbamoyl-phosphate synthase small subunit
MQQLVIEETKSLVQQSGFFFTRMSPSYLILQNGMQFKGLSPEWQKNCISGEVVFNTGMTGYEASLTDPSYAGEILMFTYPIMGNYGIPDKKHWESERIHAAGVIVCNACDQWSHGKSLSSLAEWLHSQKIPLITGIDTRHLTTILRESGTMPGAISPHLDPIPTFHSNAVSYAKSVSIPEKISYGTVGKKIVLVDCGMKRNILRNLQKFPLLIERVPFDYDYSEEDFDGIFLSNGPGNPEQYVETIKILKKAMKKEKAIFGICLGAQLLALAAGAQTYKLRYGHRSHNQPCIDLESERCYITSQNHGYAVQEASLPKGWVVNFRNLNDESVEGIRHTSLPFIAVQFHPEAAPGPTDTEWLFEKFYKML